MINLTFIIYNVWELTKSVCTVHWVPIRLATMPVMHDQSQRASGKGDILQIYWKAIFCSFPSHSDKKMTIFSFLTIADIKRKTFHWLQSRKSIRFYDHDMICIVICSTKYFLVVTKQYKYENEQYEYVCQCISIFMIFIEAFSN